jgi:hypothetical protein
VNETKEVLSMDNDPVVDTDELNWRRQNPGGEYDAQIKDVSDSTPLEQLGLRLYRLEPGQAA